MPAGRKQGPPGASHAARDEAAGVGDGGDAKGGGGAEQLQHAVAVARSVRVAHRTQQDAGEDGAGHGSDAGARDVLLVEVQVVAAKGGGGGAMCVGTVG